MTIDVFKIPRAELIIMEILWDRAAIMTTEQIVCAYNERYGKKVTASTIHTLADRLVKKRLITYVQSGGRNLYIPVWRKEKYQAFVAMQLLKELFNGSVAEMVYVMLKEGGIDVKDWEALMGLADIVDLPEEEAEESCLTILASPPLTAENSLCQKMMRTKYIPRALYGRCLIFTRPSRAAG